MGKIANFLGEKETATQKAMDVLVPSVLAGIANQATTLSGADSLLSMINEGGHDGGIFDSLGTVLGGGSATKAFLKSGETTINTLFGNKINDITNWFSGYSDVKVSSASNLLNLAAPLVLDAIGKHIGGQGSASELISLLGSQLPILKNTIPANLVHVLNLNNLNLTPPAQREALRPITDIPQALDKPIKAEKPLLKSLLPWLILLVVALLGLFYLKTCKSNATDAQTETAVIETPKSDTQPALTTEKTLKLADGDVKVKTGSFLDLLYTVINDPNSDVSKPLTFDNVSFAKYKTDLTDSSKIQLDDVVKIMKAFPNVAIKINGYTDSRGDADENKKLSQGRAASVKTYLTSKGIGNERLNAEGFGSANPIASNESEEGRTKNRRIEAILTKK